MFRLIRMAVAFLCFGVLFQGMAQDAAGCKDHPLVTRMPGYRINRCTKKEFESHAFGVKPKDVQVEGRYTEILYDKNEDTPEPSRIQIQRNYEQAITRIGGTLVGRDDDGNVFLKLVKDGKEIWIQVDAYITSQYRVVIVEKEAMKQAVVANAAVLGSGIKAEGKIAIYGITFDTGKADLKPEAEPVLAEIAKLMKAQPTLKLHVVGHTDNVAGVDLNLRLSQARAEAVVQALVSRHGIAAGRLRPQGVGPVCPVASNDTEEGRAKNRRVELVKQ